MNPLEVIKAKRQHLARMANQSGASGELSALAEMENWFPRPRGVGLKVLLAALIETGLAIKGSSFDASLFQLLNKSTLPTSIWFVQLCREGPS